MVCDFCNFITGKMKTHRNGYPLTILHKTKHTFSFMAIDFPASEDGHLVVAPKKHFENFEELPKRVLHDLSEHLALAARITRRQHEGCNILLNNGRAAEQKVPHVHFHIIPRDKGDRIHIESWKRKNLGLEKFKLISQQLRRSFTAAKL